MTVRTRFAPSPTGYLHVGGARTALYCWLHARKTGGKFVLRIEDTDRERSTEASVNAILDSMAWLGLDADEGPFYQSERFDRYREVLDQLLAGGKAYHCYCTKEELEQMRARQLAAKQKPRYSGVCRNRTEPREGVDPVVRFRTPDDGKVVVDDLLRGRVVFENSELDDLVIARSDGTPTYNFSVVVDDMDMGVTHVLRGDDHLNNTPRQINIFKALGAEPPVFAHVPMILGADGSRLSKRHGAVSVLEYRDEGYLPEALLNYLVRLGWSHGDQEIFSIDEMIELFDIGDINKSASTFNPDKLAWLNQHYIKNGDAKRLAEILKSQLEGGGIETENGPDLEGVVEAQRERAKTMAEMAQASQFFYSDFDRYEEKAAAKNLKPATAAGLEAVRDTLGDLESWDAAAIHTGIERVAESLDLKFGKVAQPVRVAVAGGPISPPIDITLELLGRDKTVERLDRALAHIAAQETA
ncbi:MAG: glutamate--tRNA ligase [Gammaproteobacteria bacterium]